MLGRRSRWVGWRNEGRSVRGRDRLGERHRCRRWFGRILPGVELTELEVAYVGEIDPLLFYNWTVCTEDELLSG